MSVAIIGDPPDIRIGHLPNASQKLYHPASLFGRELSENGGVINHRKSEEMTKNKAVPGTYQSMKPERCRRTSRLPRDRVAQWLQLRKPG